MISLNTDVLGQHAIRDMTQENDVLSMHIPYARYPSEKSCKGRESREQEFVIF